MSNRVVPRVIPTLLLKNRGLVKTVRFRQPRYVGDPIIAVRIFNDKEVDELILLDITATADDRPPDYAFLKDMASECFMPVAYGGGIKTIEQIEEIFRLGIEKVCLNSALAENPGLLPAAAAAFGSQSIVAVLDIRTSLFGQHRVCYRNASQTLSSDPVSFAKSIESRGAGEIMLNSVNRDGTMNGYELKLLERVARSVGVPVIASGGAGSLSDMGDAIQVGVSAVAAGSMFVYHGRHRAVLINYPSQEAIRSQLS